MIKLLIMRNLEVIDTLPIDEQNTTDLVDDLDFFGYDTNEEYVLDCLMVSYLLL